MLPARAATPRSFRTRAALLATTLLAASVAFGIGAAPAAAAPPYPLGPGYWLFAKDGGVFSFGDAQFFGSTGAIRPNKPIVAGAALPFLEGYWMVAEDGGIFSFGSAGFYGSTGAITLNKPIVDMAAAPSGLGYRLVASDGGIFAFGASKFFGSTGAITLNKPVVGLTTTPSGNGYWLVASDGGIFAFGDAKFFGSTGAIKLNFPVVGMASSPTGNGYHLVANDGGIFSFGDARFLGSTGAIRLSQPIEGMANRPLLGMKVDPFDADRVGRTQTWTSVGTDFQLVLSWDGVGDVPAGAKILGAEGLTVAQLGELRYVFENGAGACPGEPRLNLHVDTNNDGAGDTTRSYACTPGGALKAFNPVAGAPGAAALPGDAKVLALDVVLGAAGTANLDQFVVAGISVNDFRTFNALGPLPG